MDSPYAKELGIVFGAVQKAAEVSQSIIASSDKGIVQKEDFSPVTVADFAIQALLTATIKDAFPEDRFVGEEDASDLRQNPALLNRVWDLLGNVSHDKYSQTLCKLPAGKEHMCNLIDQCGASSPGKGRTWVFDPIDGTKGYVRKELYAINVALLVDGKQKLGVVGCPNLAINATGPVRDADVDPAGAGCIMFAVKGHGAFIRPLPGSVDQVQPESLPRQAPSGAPEIRLLTSTTVESALPHVHELMAKKLDTPYPGSDLLPWVLRWAVLAMGLANTTIWVYKKRERTGKVWDHAGAMLLFEETGGKITDIHGRDIDLTVGRKMSANYSFVGAPAQLHGKVLKVAQGVLKDQGREDLLV